MQIEQKDDQWIITPESEYEGDVLALVIPMIKRFCPDFMAWLNNVVLNALWAEPKF